MGDNTHQSSRLRVPFGERDGTMHPPDQVTRGLKCRCTCPGCGSALVANHGNHKRHYFSHYRSPECRAGYESALHKMGKQIIQEHSRVMLASYAVPVEIELIDGDVIQDRAMFQARSSDLTWVRAEKNVESWRPDLLAGLKNGATIHIEIGVTHFVDNDKAHGLDNVLEIDLSAIAPETVRDIDALREAVIDRAPRRWHRVSLYDDLERVREMRRRLEWEAKTLNAQIRKRFQQQQQKALDLDRKRREYGEHLDTLMQMSDPAVQHELRQTRREQWSEALDEMQDNIAAFCAHRGLGMEHVGMALDGDWIVQAPPVVWQFQVLSNTSTSLQVENQVEVIRSKFGFDPAIVAFALKGAVEKRQAANTEFLTPRERRALTTPHDLVRRFFDALVSIGFLEKQPYRADYTIVDTREHKRRQQIEQRQREHIRQRERAITTAEHRRHCENLLEGFLSQRVTHVRECMRCMALAKKHSTHCPICSGQALADTQLTDEVIERYREKLIS